MNHPLEYLSGNIQELNAAWAWLRGTLAPLPPEPRERAEKETPALVALALYREAVQRAPEA